MTQSSTPSPVEERDRAVELLAEIGRYGVHYTEIGKAIGCTKSTISKIVRGKRMLRSWQPGALTRKLTDLLTNIKATRAIVTRKEEELMMIREPLTGRARKYWELDGNPFELDESDDELWLDDERNHAIKEIVNAGQKHGFVAVVGPSGAGKSVVLREATRRLREREDVDVVQLDPNLNEDLTAWQLVDTLLAHFQEATWGRREARVRMAQKLLAERLQMGMRTLLVIEEAQMLRPEALRGLKRIWEWADEKRQRLLGIVLAGQPGLGGEAGGLRSMLLQNARLREIALRINLIEFRPLDSRLGEYLKFRIRRVKDGSTRLFTTDAIDQMRKRLNGASHPLVINVFAEKCLNHAAKAGKPVIDVETVDAVR